MSRPPGLTHNWSVIPAKTLGWPSRRFRLRCSAQVQRLISAQTGTISSRHPRRVNPQLTGNERSRCGDLEQAVRWQATRSKYRHTPPAALRRCPVPAATLQRGAPRQMSTVRTGDKVVARDRYSAANLASRRRQVPSSGGLRSIMTPVTRRPYEDEAAHVYPSGQAPAASETELGLSIRFPLLVVFLPLGSWWIPERSDRRVPGVEMSGRDTGPRREVRSA